MKRIFDFGASLLGIIALSPVFLLVILAIYVEDRHNPFYVGRRVGRGGEPFNMVKFRSMTPMADRTGVDSTAASDPRITRVGRYIRALKLDEFSQLLNVLRGDMSLVGPRPQVQRDAALWTDVERGVLKVRPGITDFSSIVFADEGEILRGAEDPDLRYHQIIRPWKGRLGLHYVAVSTLWLDIRLILATILSAASRRMALRWTSHLIRVTGGPPDLVAIALRRAPLQPAPPAGSSEIVIAR